MRSRRLPLALAAMVAAAMATPAHAQLNLNLGGISVSVGGGSGGVSASVEALGLDVEVGLGGSGGADGDLPDNTAPAEHPPGEDESALVEDGPLSQDETLVAVKSKRAVPLAPIIAQLQREKLRVIDAQLLTVRGVLLYELRVIGERGDVSEVYFYAWSGRRVIAD